LSKNGLQSTEFQSLGLKKKQKKGSEAPQEPLLLLLQLESFSLFPPLGSPLRTLLVERSLSGQRTEPLFKTGNHQLSTSKYDSGGKWIEWSGKAFWLNSTPCY
jgi:hypothetical protein